MNDSYFEIAISFQIPFLWCCWPFTLCYNSLCHLGIQIGKNLCHLLQAVPILFCSPGFKLIDQNHYPPIGLSFFLFEKISIWSYWFIINLNFNRFIILMNLKVWFIWIINPSSFYIFSDCLSINYWNWIQSIGCSYSNCDLKQEFQIKWNFFHHNLNFIKIFLKEYLNFDY